MAKKHSCVQQKMLGIAPQRQSRTVQALKDKCSYTIILKWVRLPPCFIDSRHQDNQNVLLYKHVSFLIYEAIHECVQTYTIDGSQVSKYLKNHPKKMHLGLCYSLLLHSAFQKGQFQYLINKTNLSIYIHGHWADTHLFTIRPLIIKIRYVLIWKIKLHLLNCVECLLFLHRKFQIWQMSKKK